MRVVQPVKAVLLAACVAGAITTSAKGATDPAAVMMAQRLIDDAFSQSRNPTVKPSTAAQESLILLQMANRLDPEDIFTLKLLVEAAVANKNTDVQRDALRQLIKLDPGDLVAQVQYLDFLASTKQSLDERGKVYAAAFGSKTLNPQIRSRMAVRLADIASERGDGAAVRSYLKQALQLDNVNVEALREVVQLAGHAPQTHLTALIMLLTANPYQPDAWVSCSRVLSATNLHSQAADFLIVSIEQMQDAGTQIPSDLYLELGVELTSAGRFVEAHPILANLSRLPDAPLSALVAHRLLLEEYQPPVFVPDTRPTMDSPADTAPATAPSTQATTSPSATNPAATAPATSEPTDMLPILPDDATATTATAPAPDTAPAAATAPATDATTAPATQSSADKLNDLIRGQLSASIEKDPNSTVALGQALWIEFSVMQDVNPKSADWLKHYAELVGADDPTLARLNGWSLLRAGKLDEAKAVLEKRAAADPMAELGLARVLIAQGKLTEGATQLQDLWSSHPTGLLALEIIQTVRQNKITLTDTGLTREVSAILQQLPAGSMTAHRTPRDIDLVTGSLVKARVDFQEPILMNIRISNGAGRPLSVGEDGAIKTRLGLLGRSRGMGATDLGLFAVMDVQRVYRLEPQDEIDATVRVDSGVLSELLQSNALREYTVELKILTVPRGLTESPAAGLGGQEITVDNVDRVSTPGITLNDYQELTDQMVAASGAKKLALTQMNAGVLYWIPEEVGVPSQDPDKVARQELRSKVISAYLTMCISPSPLERAMIVRSLPPIALGEALEVAVDKLMEDPDPLVRMEWAWKLMRVGVISLDLRQTMMDNLLKMARAEQDPLVRNWMFLMHIDMDEQIRAQFAAAKARTTPQPPVNTEVKPPSPPTATQPTSIDPSLFNHDANQ